MRVRPSDQRRDPLPDRHALEAAWLELTRTTLPALADARSWPIRHDHCFQRVLLDNAVGGRWYDHIPKRPAYAHAPDATLARAVALGGAVIGGSADLAQLDCRSLAWRRKAGAGDVTRRTARPGYRPED